MRRTTRTTTARVIALSAAAALVLGACGDDDDGDADGATGATSAPSTSEFCEAYVAADDAIDAADEGDDPEPALRAVRELAPADIAGDVETWIAELLDESEGGADGGEEGPPPIPGPAFFEANEAVGDYVAQECGFPVIEVTARDYELDGIPDEFGAGTTLIKFTNEGSEWHEVVPIQLVEGEERPLEELLALPEEEQQELGDGVGFVFAPPSATAYTVVDFQPGRHVGLCFIPVGTTPEVVESGGDGDGPPHFMEGMTAEFRVTS